MNQIPHAVLLYRICFLYGNSKRLPWTFIALPKNSW